MNDEMGKIFWPSWLMPFVLIALDIYMEVFGKPHNLVIFVVLGSAMFMWGRPMSHYMAKNLTFEQLAFNGFLLPFIIWVVLVFIKIIIFRLVA
jgi:hypothetical protein